MMPAYRNTTLRIQRTPLTSMLKTPAIDFDETNRCGAIASSGEPTADDRDQHDRGGNCSTERRTPTACNADRKDDRRRLDALNGRRRKRCAGKRKRAHVCYRSTT